MWVASKRLRHSLHLDPHLSFCWEMEDVVHISLKVALNKPKVKVDEELVKKRCASLCFVVT